MHYDWCDGLQAYTNPNKHLQAKNRATLDSMLANNQPQEDILDFLKKAPKGSIDIGHAFNVTPRSSSDFDDMIGHHLDGVRDLKDIHDHHGGLDAVEGILRNYHGRGGTPSEYTGLNFGKHNKKVHAEAMDLVNPGKGAMEDVDEKDTVDYRQHTDPVLDKHVDHTWDAYEKAQDLEDEDDTIEKEEEHAQSVFNRAMDAFKRYHKL